MVFFQNDLFEVQAAGSQEVDGPNDPVTVLAAGLLILTVAVAASWLPTRRAARLDPLDALKSS